MNVLGRSLACLRPGALVRFLLFVLFLLVLLLLILVLFLLVLLILILVLVVPAPLLRLLPARLEICNKFKTLRFAGAERSVAWQMCAGIINGERGWQLRNTKTSLDFHIVAGETPEFETMSKEPRRATVM